MPTNNGARQAEIEGHQVDQVDLIDRVSQLFRSCLLKKKENVWLAGKARCQSSKFGLITSNFASANQ